MLRVAVPNKGGLSEPASRILRESGYRQRQESRDLVALDHDNEVEFYFLRPRDIAVYVGEGTLDVGITGRDFLRDSGARAHEVLALGFGSSTFRWAGLPGTAWSVQDLAGRRIATSFAGIVRGHLREHRVDAHVVQLDGAVETAIRLGVADVVAEVVETGSTLRQAGLELFGEPLLRSEAVLICRDEKPEPPGLQALVRRLHGVLVARDYVMMDYDVPSERLTEAAALTPGLESPTVSPLQREGWVAVRSMVPRKQAQRVMDELWEVGARAILVTEIHACRL